MTLPEIQSLHSALADETRLRVMNLLGRGELCVCDLMCVLKEPQSKVSRHLAYLRRSGLVKARKQGLWMYYRLADASLRLKQSCAEFDRDLKTLEKNRKSLVACCK